VEGVMLWGQSAVVWPKQMPVLSRFNQMHIKKIIYGSQTYQF
jgi:hypothetical protein